MNLEPAVVLLFVLLVYVLVLNLMHRKPPPTENLLNDEDLKRCIRDIVFERSRIGHEEQQKQIPPFHQMFRIVEYDLSVGQAGRYEPGKAHRLIMEVLNEQK